MTQKKTNKQGQKQANSLFVLYVYNNIKAGKTPKQIAQILNITPQAVSYHLRKLKASGSIQKIGYGTWEALEFNPKQDKQTKVGGGRALGSVCLSSFSKIRGHGFKFRVKIPNLSNWSRRVEFLDKRKIEYEVINKGFTQRIVFRGCKVWLNSSSIVVYFPKDLSFVSDSASDSEGRAFFEIVELMKGLDSLFKVSFKINKSYQIKVFGKHFADVGNGLAKMYKRDRRSIRVHNSDGLWLLIDDSFGLAELETVGVSGRNDSTKDMDSVVKPFFNSLKDMPFVSNDHHKLGHLVADLIESHKNNVETVSNTVVTVKAVVDILATLVKPKTNIDKPEVYSKDTSECDYIG